MQTGMKDTARIIRHENLHLPLRQRFNIEIGDSVLLILAFDSCACLLVPFVDEEPLLSQAVASPRYGGLRRSTNEVARGFLVARSKNDGRVGCRRNVLFESTTNLHQLRQTLH